MATETFEQSANSRLHSISEELTAINSEIIANLELLPDQKELVERLLSRCDGIALELDAIRLEFANQDGGTPAGEKKSPEPSGDGSGLMP